MPVAKKQITEITITGFGPDIALEISGDLAGIYLEDGASVEFSGDLARVIATELLAYFGPMGSK